MTQPCYFSPAFRLLALSFVAWTGFAMTVSAEDESGRQFFKDRVYPILKENCFKCHGAGEHLKGDFRITSREGLIHGGHFGPGYNEQDPAASVLLEMISYKSDEYQMPPKGKLPESQIAILTEWIDRGAPYDESLEIKGGAHERRGFTVTESDREWWAYRPVSKADPPAVGDSLWARNGIDAFIKSQLDRENLTPNDRATPEVLIRRLYYDLIGLPPTPQQVEAFVRANQKDEEAAYVELVEDLLSRPQYGEKWARHWLDVVRYAESNGFERDNPKPHIWRYRDYVIDAFNQDKPYDRFVLEQIAGDEIENPTKESMIATGYHRLMQWDDEPADRKQHVYDVLADNVQVTTETFLATTLGCARCHDHKADPVSQKDYFSFMAFYSGVTHYDTQGTLVNWATPEEKESFERTRQQTLTQLKRKRDDLEEKIEAVLEKTDGSTSSPVQAITYVDDARDGGQDWFYTTKKPTDDWSDVGFINKSWYKAKGGFGAGDPPNSVIRTPWDGAEIWMRTTFGLTAIPESLTMEIYHDENVEVYLNGHLVYEAGGYTTDYEVITLGQEALDVLQTGKNTVAVYCRNSTGGQNIDLSLRTRASEVLLEQRLSGRKAKQLTEKVKAATGDDLVGEYQKVISDLANWRQRKPGVPLNVVTEKGAEAPVMHVHLRGSAHAPGEEVQPGLPAVIASEGSDPEPVEAQPVIHDERVSSGRRLELAKWMIDPDNPLTPRVMANRIWQHHFGRGIVPTTSDFGQLGEKPTHPELLDWLAHQFVEKGWSMKEMHRLILHSRTYQMSSEPNSANLASDPQNNHFWRFSMRRLTAEELRDTMLSVSGNLNLKTHGEWVYPPLPPEVLATSSRPGKGWPVSKNEEDHYRRSLYVHVKRSLRHQMLADFDQADTDTACAVRFVTTVPTQALSMLNSRFVNDQAAVFADRMRSFGGDVRHQIASGLEWALQRKAKGDEVDYLVSFHDSLQEKVNLSSEEALDRVALLTLNLNEFIYLD